MVLKALNRIALGTRWVDREVIWFCGQRESATRLGRMVVRGKPPSFIVPPSPLPVCGCPTRTMNSPKALTSIPEAQPWPNAGSMLGLAAQHCVGVGPSSCSHACQPMKPWIPGIDPVFNWDRHSCMGPPWGFIVSTCVRVLWINEKNSGYFKTLWKKNITVSQNSHLVTNWCWLSYIDLISWG